MITNLLPFLFSFDVIDLSEITEIVGCLALHDGCGGGNGQCRAGCGCGQDNGNCGANALQIRSLDDRLA